MSARSKATTLKKGKAAATTPLSPNALPDGLKEFEVSDSTTQNLEDLVAEGGSSFLIID